MKLFKDKVLEVGLITEINRQQRNSIQLRDILLTKNTKYYFFR